MPRCNMCGRETQAFKMNEGGEWNWYCGDCYRSFAIEKKIEKVVKGDKK